MKDIRMHMTVEQPVNYPKTEGGPMPLNDLARRGAYATTRSETDDTVFEAWKIPDGAEMSLPVTAADALISLGYAEEITAPAAP